MAVLTAKKRNALPSSSFALPDERKYPIKTKSGAPDENHASNAKARAQQQFDKGNLSKGELEKIDRKANGILNAGKKKLSGKPGLLNN